MADNRAVLPIGAVLDASMSLLDLIKNGDLKHDI